MIVCHEHYEHMTCLNFVKFAFTGGTGVYKTLSIISSDLHRGAYWVVI